MDRSCSRLLGAVRLGADRAFTLVELLVVVAIMSLLIALLLPALSGAKQEAGRAKCIANMKQLCDSTMAYAVDHPEADPALVVPSWWSERAGDSGFYDYGGGNGRQDGLGQWGLHGAGRRSAGARPLNQFIFGAELTGDEDYSLFQCPGDFGWVEAPFYAASWPAQWRTRPFHASTGTSYRANAARAARAERIFSMSPYLRPVTRIPAPAETLSYSESIHWLARWNTTSASQDAYTPTGMPPMTIPGWHGKPGRFNIGFADGHAAWILMDRAGMDPGLGANHPLDPGDSQVWTRGPGPQRWRIDIRREPLIEITR